MKTKNGYGLVGIITAMTGCDVAVDVKVNLDSGVYDSTDDTSLYDTTKTTDTSDTAGTGPFEIPESYDVMIKESDPDANYEGWAAALGADYDGAERILRYFDVSSLEGMTIINAELQLKVYSQVCHSATTGECADAYGNPLEIHGRVYRVASSWDPLTVTFNTRPASDDETDINSYYVEATIAPSAEEINVEKGIFPEYSLDVTALVQEWQTDPTTNYGFLLRARNGEERGGSAQADVYVGGSGKNAPSDTEAILLVTTSG